ncbi:Putative acyl-CoA N-acyltransferase [Septoria linicola]|uniref:Acyl-CoA N-acyltransferase n=1 Tax=Septoria linicola TaxID=215465 RepID=A0A9Q9ANG4_9PEZI|nr:Putative acyl-CoA N-acyltransferase [Septoria linicola]
MIEYREATLQDLNSLSTIFPRSFHKVNPFMKQLIPDTPVVRTWWRRIFEADIENPNCHVLIALDESTSEVVGSVQLRGMKRGSHFGGFMAEHSITKDHDAETWSAAIKAFAANEERIVGDRDRYLIEVMCVDHEY